MYILWPCKVNISPQKRSGRPFPNSRNSLACCCIYTLITSLLFQVYRKCGSKLTQAYNKIHVYATVVPYSGTSTCKWLCACKIWWSLVTFSRYSRSLQTLFCTKSSVRGISVIKTRWSSTRVIVKSSFYCTCFSSPARVYREPPARECHYPHYFHLVGVWGLCCFSATLVSG